MIGWAPRLRNAFGADQTLVRAGTFNAGLLAVGEGAEPFLDWWNDRTARYCLLEPGRALFVDQGWLALVPTLFDCHIVREPGMERQRLPPRRPRRGVGGRRPRRSAASRSAAFTSSPSTRCARPAQPRAQHRRRVADGRRATRRRAAVSRVRRARARGRPRGRAGGGGAVRAPGRRDARWTRTCAPSTPRRCCDTRREMGEAPPNPFGDGDAEEFLRWLDEPWEGQDDEFPAVSRYLVGLHTRFDWVYGSFKEVPGADAERYPALAARGRTSAGTSIFPSAGCLPGRRPAPDPALAGARGPLPRPPGRARGAARQPELAGDRAAAAGGRPGPPPSLESAASRT